MVEVEVEEVTQVMEMDSYTKINPIFFNPRYQPDGKTNSMLAWIIQITKSGLTMNHSTLSISVVTYFHNSSNFI